MSWHIIAAFLCREAYNVMFPLAATFREARRQRGLSQEALGKTLKIPQAHVSAMEAGGVDVRASTLTAWARALGLELLVVPREIVPAVQYLQKEMSAPARDPERASPPLYEATETDLDNDDQPAPRP
jgi:transcriptional regulator with XRE-family HTH domain